MKPEKWFKGLIDSYKDDLEFQTEEIILEFTEKIAVKMEASNINRSELAGRLGVSKAFVTKLLNGNPDTFVKSRHTRESGYPGNM